MNKQRIEGHFSSDLGHFRTILDAVLSFRTLWSDFGDFRPILHSLGQFDLSDFGKDGFLK